MTDCILKQIETSAKKQEWDGLVQKVKKSKASQEEVQNFLQSVTDNDIARQKHLRFSS